MAKKKSAKLRPDVAEVAFRVMQEAVGDAPKTLPPRERPERNAEAVERGRKGGHIGGKVRAAKLDKARRIEIAREAAHAQRRRKPDPS